MSGQQQLSQGHEAVRYLTFRLDEEVYKVPILHVREIIEMQEISPVPRSVSWVCGVVNLRGRVLPVIDPKIRFGLAPVVPSELTVILVLQTDAGKLFGVLVDEVLEVNRIDDSNISEAPMVSASSEQFVTGVGKVRDQIVFLLEPSALSVQ